MNSQNPSRSYSPIVGSLAANVGSCSPYLGNSMPNSGSKPSNSRSLLSVAGQNVRENVPLEAKPSSSRGFPDKMTGKMSGEIFQAASGGSPRASDPPTPPRHTSCAPPPVRLAQGRPLPDRIAQLPEPIECGVFDDGFIETHGFSPSGGSALNIRSKSDSNNRSCTMRYFSNSLSAWAWAISAVTLPAS